MIGEYGLDGSTIDASLISSGLDGPYGMAISGSDLFVANYYGGTVGEFGLDGSTVNASLISGLDHPADVAINPVPEPSAIAIAVLGTAALRLWPRRRRA